MTSTTSWTCSETPELGRERTWLSLKVAYRCWTKKSCREIWRIPPQNPYEDRKVCLLEISDEVNFRMCRACFSTTADFQIGQSFAYDGTDGVRYLNLFLNVAELEKSV